MPRDARKVEPRAAALALLVALAAPVADPLGAADDAPAALAGIQAWLDGTRDLQARFEQQLLSGAFGAGAAETGRLWIERPGRMRWDYLEPEAKVAVLDGDRTWLLLEEERQLILGRLDRESELLPTLLAGDRRLADLFTATDAGRTDDGAVQLRLVPRESDAAFEAVLVTARPPEWAIESAEVLDAAGSRVQYRFGRLRRNRGVDPGMFRLEAGPGVEVSGSHEPAAAGS